MRTMGLEEGKVWGQKMCVDRIFQRSQNLPKVTVLRREEDFLKMNDMNGINEK